LFAARLWAGNVSLLEVMAWVPAMLYGAERYRAAPGWRTWLVLTGVLALSLLVGFYHPWFLALLAVALYLAWMPASISGRLKCVAGLGLAVLAAAGLAAPQLLPAIELIRWTTRSGRLEWDFATAASLPPWHMLSLLLPEVFGSGAGTYWPGPWWHWQELTAYAGLLPLLLAALACTAPREPRKSYCLVLGGTALVLALGRYTPVYGWFYDWIPGYGSFRDPGRHLLLFSLSMALLAGWGADRLWSGHGRRAVLAVLVGIFVVAAAGAVATVWLADDLAGAVVPLLSAIGLWTPRLDQLEQSPAQLGAAVLLLVGRACGVAVIGTAAALVAVVLARRCPPRWRALFLLGAVFADLSMFGWRYVHEPLPIAPGIPFGSPTAQFDDFLGQDTVTSLRQNGSASRVAPLGRDASIVGNAGYLLGVPLAIGLDPLLPRRYAELVALINGEPLAAFENLILYLEDRPSHLWPLLAAHYRLVARAAGTSDDPPGFAIRADTGALPRVFAVETVRGVQGSEASLAALSEPGFRPAAEAVLETEASAPALPARSRASTGRARAHLDKAANGAVDITADVPDGGAVIVLDAWHPGWTATVAGRAVAVYPADHAFLGVVLPPGTHEVRLRFDPASWRIGLIVAGGTLLSLVVVGAVASRQGQAGHG
jgi:hypothetical protein